MKKIFFWRNTSHFLLQRHPNTTAICFFQCSQSIQTKISIVKTLTLDFLLHRLRAKAAASIPPGRYISYSSSASSPSLSIWRRKKEMGKEGLFVVHELKRLQSNRVRLEQFMHSHVSRLLRTDLLAVLAEFQRQDQAFLSMKIYDIVRKEIWYCPDMFLYRDMLLMLARNKRLDETKRVWEDSKQEKVLFDQHTYGDIVRSFLDNGLPSQAMEFYDVMRQSPDPPLCLPYRVILKGLLPYPELREKVKQDFLEVFPDMSVYDPPEDLLDDQNGEDEEC